VFVRVFLCWTKNNDFGSIWKRARLAALYFSVPAFFMVMLGSLNWLAAYYGTIYSWSVVESVLTVMCWAILSFPCFVAGASLSRYSKSSS